MSEGAACRSFLLFSVAAGRRESAEAASRRLSLFSSSLRLTSQPVPLLKTSKLLQLRHVRPPRRRLRGPLRPHRARRSCVQPLGLRVSLEDARLFLLLPCVPLRAVVSSSCSSSSLRSLSLSFAHVTPQPFSLSRSLSLSLSLSLWNRTQDSLQAPQVHLPPLLQAPHEGSRG